MKKIAVIPIDNRPICYTLIEQVLAINENIELFMPKRSLLGGLATMADVKGIFDWIKTLGQVDYFIISLDTVAYGGLVASRRIPDDYDTIKSRLLEFKELIKSLNTKVYAFSSIMRISNNNINEEEKEYWNPWGERIFSYSYHAHKSRIEKSDNCAQNEVPEDILNDYLQTRTRNFKINELYLDWIKEGVIDTLIYSKDDTGQYGLNVEEAQKLEQQANSRKLNAIIKTGADEIPLSLITRALTDGESVKIKPVFKYGDSIRQISKYEDISVENCVKAQLELAGVESCTSKNPEITMYVNNFEDEQGDLVLGTKINSFKGDFKMPETPYFIADISNANGSDNELARILTDTKCETGQFLGYSGYNTSANTIGSAVFIAMTSYLAQKQGVFNVEAFKKAIFVRFLDDWAYQANARKAVRESAPDFAQALEGQLANLSRYERKIKEFLGFDYKKVTCSLPWNRSFEVEIDVNNI